MPWESLPTDPVELGGYRISRRLGAGGMGRVYLAFTPGGRPVALKVLRPELGDDPEFRARFRQEVAAARRVSGLFTAQVLDGDPDGTPPWLATTYVPGPSLAQAVADHGPLPEASVLLLMAGVAEALQAIHAAGLVHRDLKPSNVLLAPDGPRVIDFGIARAAQSTSLTRTGFRIGSPQFMSPEQVEGGAVSGAVDVFALGSLAFYAATGRSPFGDGDEAGVLYRVLHGGPDLRGCPGSLLGLIGACLTRDPAARPAPAQIIGQCRAQIPAGRFEFTGSWLPPAVAATLAPQPVAPPPAAMAPPTLQSSPAFFPPAPQPPPAGFPMAPQPPSAAPTMRPTLVAPDGPPPPPRRLSRAVLGGAVAVGVVVAALAVYGLVTLVGRGHDGGSPPSPSATLDRCLVGTWSMTAVTFPNIPASGQDTTFTGDGPTVTFLADGDTSIDYAAGAGMTAQIEGITVTVDFYGSFTAHYSARNGTLRTWDDSVHAGYSLLRNGSPAASAPFSQPSQNSGSGPYTCSADTLRLPIQDGITEVMTRDTPEG
jgi:Protein kinase domain